MVCPSVANVMVLRRQTLSGIDHKNDRIGFGHGLACLLGHFFVDTAVSGGLKATRVNHDEFVLAVFRTAIVAIAGQTCIVGDDGIAGFGDAVEQR
jgi:hypothetical protein